MKKIIILLISLFIITGCTKNTNELVMVTEAGFAPYEYYEGGEIVGVDVDIAKYIASSLKDVSFDSIINEVKSGKADFGAAGISYTPERSQEVDFSINYSTSKQVIIVKSSSSIKGPSDINNKKLGVQLGSIADTYLTKNYKNSTITRQKKYLTLVEDLKSDKVDAIVMDLLPAKEIIKVNKGLIILDEELTHDEYGMIVKKGNEELLSNINKCLEELKSSGKIDEYIINHTK